MQSKFLKIWRRYGRTALYAFMRRTSIPITLTLLLVGPLCNSNSLSGKSCRSERQENTDCYKHTYGYYLNLCGQDMRCMYERNYLIDVYFTCDVIGEPVPARCNQP